MLEVWLLIALRMTCSTDSAHVAMNHIVLTLP